MGDPVADITFSQDGAVQRWLVDLSLYQRYEQGSLIEERPFTPDDLAFVTLVQAADATSTGDFLTRVRNALTANRTYLDKVTAGTVTQADHIAQVPTLTRQVQALIVYTVLHGD